MPDRGKERDGTDGIMLPSNLLLHREKTAATHGRTGYMALAMPSSLTCSQGAASGPSMGFGQPCRELGWSNGHAGAGRTKAGWKWGFTVLLAPRR